MRSTIGTRTLLAVDVQFDGEVWFWKGPPPHHFVTVPTHMWPAFKEAAELVSYGWGVVPVAAQIRGTTWTTSLFPKDGGYIVPLKATVRKAEQVELGDTVTIRISVHVPT